MSYFTDNFSGRMNSADFEAIVEALCLIADEMKMRREFEQEREERITEENARADELERQKVEAQNKNMDVVKEMLSGGIKIGMSVPVPTFPLGYAPSHHPAPACICSHPAQYHETETGPCIGFRPDGDPCNCKEFTPGVPPETRPTE